MVMVVSTTCLPSWADMNHAMRRNGSMAYFTQSSNGVAHTARAIWNNVALAGGDKFIVVESNCYFPPEEVHFEFLREHAGYHIECSWKGAASYYDVIEDGQTNVDAVWSHLEPKPKAVNISRYVAFWKGVHVEA
jgi:uncharacterized protein (DUF427 family)